MKRRIKWILSVTLVLAATFVAPLAALAEEFIVPVWKFEVDGAYSLIKKFDSDATVTRLVERKECFMLDQESGKSDKRAGLIIVCKRTVESLNVLTVAFAQATTPPKDEALIVPLTMTITSLSILSCSPNPDCSVCKCSTGDGGTCSPTSVGGNIICKHRLHDCVSKQ